MRKYYLKLVCFSLLLFATLNSGGCFFGDRIPRFCQLENVANSKNAFKIPEQECKEREYVDVVIVRKADNQDEEVWFLSAEKAVKAKSFVITLGQIPPGFRQIKPKPPDQFRPIPGETYSILISTRRSYFGMENWVAE